MSGFSLWTEPWVPVQTLEGAPRKVTLPEALTEAHALRGILDPSPLVTVALHRLLVALIYRTHDLHGMAQWMDVWKSGRFNAAAIDAYGSRQADRFDLLHPTHPFYQVPFQPDEKVHPVAALLLEAASGNNPALFDHGLVEGSDVLPLDRAACYLLAHQLFAIGGGVSKPFNRMDAPLTKGLVVEVTGQTLFETLALNAMPMEQWRDRAPVTTKDRPFWEEDHPEPPVKEGTTVRGPLHYLTWQSRQISLVVDRNRRVVTGCQIAQRYCLPKDGLRPDPGKAYYEDEQKGWLPKRLQKDRAAWRLTHVLLQPTETGKVQPQVVAWLGALRNRDRQLGTVRLPRQVALSVSGLTTDPKLAAKIDLWRREEIGLPLAILDEPDLIKQVDRLMKTADDVARLLQRTAEALVWALAERHQRGKAQEYVRTGKTGTAKLPPTVPAVARSLGVTLRYWAAMEEPFRTALWQLPEASAADVSVAWQATLQQNARLALRSALDSLQGSGAPWEPLSLIEAAFERTLRWVLESKEVTKSDDDDEEE